MRLFHIVALIIVCAAPAFAEPRIDEHTLIQGTGWSDGFSQNESLACDVAQARAKQHLTKGLAYARSKGFVSPDELMHALLQPATRTWQNGRCVIQLEMTVPVLPKSSVPVMHERVVR